MLTRMTEEDWATVLDLDGLRRAGDFNAAYLHVEPSAEAA